MTYEGYSNRETAAICLMINNNENFHEYSKRMLTALRDQWANPQDIPPAWTDPEQFITYEYAAALKRWITHLVDREAGRLPKTDVKLLILELIGLQYVNWREVAKDQMQT